MDRLYSLCQEIGVEDPYPNWKPSVSFDDDAPFVIQGSHYAINLMMNRLSNQDGCAPILEIHEGGGRKPARFVPTQDDLEIIMADEELLSNANLLIQRAAAINLILPVDNANRLIALILGKQQAFLHLKENNYKELLNTIQVAAPETATETFENVPEPLPRIVPKGAGVVAPHLKAVGANAVSIKIKPLNLGGALDEGALDRGALDPVDDDADEGLGEPDNLNEEEGAQQEQQQIPKRKAKRPKRILSAEQNARRSALRGERIPPKNNSKHRRKK